MVSTNKLVTGIIAGILVVFIIKAVTKKDNGFKVFDMPTARRI